MSETPTQIMWRLAGEPEPSKGELMPMDGACLVCGETSDVGVREKKAIPRTDTDRDCFAAPWSDMVCAGCVWCSEGRPPDTVRLWSMIYSEAGVDQPGLFAEYMDKKRAQYEEKGREWDVSVEALVEAGDTLCLTNKRDLTPVTRLLCDPPDAPYFAAIADSGQIHIVRYCRINQGPSWTVRFEREDVDCDGETYARIMWHAATLKKAGFYDDEILTGNPKTHTLMKVGAAVWMTHSEPLAPYHRSSVLRMALFCLTKDTTDEHHRIAQSAVGSAYRRDVDERGRGLVASLPSIHPARQHRPQEVLGSRPEGASGGSTARADDGADDQRDPQSTADRRGVHQEVKQASLFDL